jgi:membrane dipeptidase
MKLIDFHCDTAYRMHKENTIFLSNNFHVSLDKVAKFENYAQIMAIFISNKLSDEDGYNRFHEIYGYFSAEMAENKDRIVKITDGRTLTEVWNSKKHAAILSVEDARILAGKLERLDVLYDKGVRFLVLMWSGETCIGGSHNTEAGLTDFGKKVTERCFELGIIPDVSHASEQTASDMIEIAQKYGKPLIASHSNSHAVLGHTRNLRDRHFEAIRDMGGIVGISLCHTHLAPEGNAKIDDVIRHIEHYLSLGGENTIAFGCDFDGTDLPEGISDVSDLTKIADRMVQLGYKEELIEKLFWRNAERFITGNVR